MRRAALILALLGSAAASPAAALSPTCAGDLERGEPAAMQRLAGTWQTIVDGSSAGLTRPLQLRQTLAADGAWLLEHGEACTAAGCQPIPSRTGNWTARAAEGDALLLTILEPQPDPLASGTVPCLTATITLPDAATLTIDGTTWTRADPAAPAGE